MEDANRLTGKYQLAWQMVAIYTILVPPSMIDSRRIECFSTSSLLNPYSEHKTFASFQSPTTDPLLHLDLTVLVIALLNVHSHTLFVSTTTISTLTILSKITCLSTAVPLSSHLNQLGQTSHESSCSGLCTLKTSMSFRLQWKCAKPDFLVICEFKSWPCFPLPLSILTSSKFYKTS